MDKSSSNGTAVLGTELPTISEADAIRMINRDLPMAIACLNAINTDPDMKAALARFMIGRVENHNEQVRIKKVADLEKDVE